VVPISAVFYRVELSPEVTEATWQRIGDGRVRGLCARNAADTFVGIVIFCSTRTPGRPRGLLPRGSVCRSVGARQRLRPPADRGGRRSVQTSGRETALLVEPTKAMRRRAGCMTGWRKIRASFSTSTRPVRASECPGLNQPGRCVPPPGDVIVSDSGADLGSQTAILHHGSMLGRLPRHASYILSRPGYCRATGSSAERVSVRAGEPAVVVKPLVGHRHASICVHRYASKARGITRSPNVAE